MFSWSASSTLARSAVTGRSCKATHGSIQMRPIVCGGAIFSRITKNSKMRTPLVWDDAKKQKLNSNTVSFFSCFVLLTLFVLTVCVLDTGWSGMEEGWVLVDSNPVLARSRRVLQSSWESDLVDGRPAKGALHGMGFTFRTGSWAVNELIVVHVAEQTTAEELRLFLRTLHRSGATARADVVFLFPLSITEEIVSLFDAEESSFKQLMVDRQSTAPPHRPKGTKHEESEEVVNKKTKVSLRVAAPEIRPFETLNSTISPFNSRAFWKARDERKGQNESIMWEMRNGETNSSDDFMASVDWADWGSIVGFEMQDLDQDEVLKGFIDEPPLQLRRWGCYNMLLGMVKSRYRTIVLTEARSVYILGDVLSPTRRKNSDFIYFYEEDRSWNDAHKTRQQKPRAAVGTRKAMAEELFISKNFPHGSLVEGATPEARQEVHFIEEVYGRNVWKFLDKDDKAKSVLESAFVMGHIRAVRSLANAMMTEIANIAMKRKNRQAFHDQAILNHLVRKSSALGRRVTDKLRLLRNGESSVHAVTGSKQANYFFREDGTGFAALVGMSNEVGEPRQTASVIGRIIRAEICSSSAESFIYGDCNDDRTVGR